ncbi:hypothetical protein J6590_017334 [Homalodisca vitripennis]|nr:hypothetical protein J6590_017334 [Homalodisca vitripennis]
MCIRCTLDLAISEVFVSRFQVSPLVVIRCAAQTHTGSRFRAYLSNLNSSVSQGRCFVDGFKAAAAKPGSTMKAMDCVIAVLNGARGQSIAVAINSPASRLGQTEDGADAISAPPGHL